VVRINLLIILSLYVTSSYTKQVCRSCALISFFLIIKLLKFSGISAILKILSAVVIEISWKSFRKPLTEKMQNFDFL